MDRPEIPYTRSTAKHKVIYDTDPGVDDIIGLLLLLTSENIELALITVVFGNTEVNYAYNNVLKTYQAVVNHVSQHPSDKHRFPGLESRPTVCSGAFEPLASKLQLAEYFHGPDGLSDITTTHPEFDIEDPSALSKFIKESSVAAEDAIIDLLLKEPDDTVTVIAVGPLTNIARAWIKKPEALERARRIVVMGGALDAPGNTSATAEFNFFADPKAATLVMDAAKSEIINLILVPLDLTSSHSVPFSGLIHPLLLSGPLLKGPELSKSMSPLRAFTSAFLYRVRQVMRDLGAPDAFEMHDPAAVWAALSHASIPRSSPLLQGWGTVKRDFVIECIGEYTRGMCVVDRRGGTDATGALRSVDGVHSSNNQENTLFGVKVLNKTPGATMLEKEVMGRLFWDIQQPS